jgi:hypothetical protein
LISSSAKIIEKLLKPAPFIIFSDTKHFLLVLNIHYCLCFGLAAYNTSTCIDAKIIPFVSKYSGKSMFLSCQAFGFEILPTPAANGQESGASDQQQADSRWKLNTEALKLPNFRRELGMFTDQHQRISNDADAA